MTQTKINDNFVAQNNNPPGNSDISELPPNNQTLSDIPSPQPTRWGSSWNTPSPPRDPNAPPSPLSDINLNASSSSAPSTFPPSKRLRPSHPQNSSPKGQPLSSGLYHKPPHLSRRVITLSNIPTDINEANLQSAIELFIKSSQALQDLTFSFSLSNPKFKPGSWNLTINNPTMAYEFFRVLIKQKNNLINPLTNSPFQNLEFFFVGSIKTTSSIYFTIPPPLLDRLLKETAKTNLTDTNLMDTFLFPDVKQQPPNPIQ